MAPPSPRRPLWHAPLCCYCTHLLQSSFEVTTPKRSGKEKVKPLNQHASKKPDRAAQGTIGRRLAPHLFLVCTLAPTWRQPMASVSICQAICLVLEPGVMNQLRSVDSELTRDLAPLRCGWPCGECRDLRAAGAPRSRQSAWQGAVDSGLCDRSGRTRRGNIWRLFFLECR